MVRRTKVGAVKEFSVDPTSQDLNLDFDRWAAEVRQQMLAALRKRNSDPEEID